VVASAGDGPVAGACGFPESAGREISSYGSLPLVLCSVVGGVESDRNLTFRHPASDLTAGVL